MTMAKKERRSHSLKKRFALGGLALLGLLASALPHDKQTIPDNPIIKSAEASAKPITAAYVYDGAALSFDEKDGAKLDQLNFSFALIKNGKATGAHWNKIDTYKAFIAKHPNITPVLSVGGWGADGFSQACATQLGRQTLAKSLIDLMQQHGFLGVDIDWEYPGSSVAGIASNANDKANLTLFLEEMRARLDVLTNADGKKRLLAIAVSGDPAMVRSIDCSAVGRIADQINVMTYDLHQGAQRSTHHAALYSTSSNTLSAQAAVNAYRSAGIPSGKLMIGAAFYGRGWSKIASTQNNGLAQKTNNGSVKNFSYARILELIQSGKSTAYYDEQAQAAYLFDGSTFVSYDNARSILAKGRYVKENGLMGLMCWEYGGDVGSELLTALHNSVTE